MTELYLRSPGSGNWLSCGQGDVIWLDRQLLSAGRDRTLHRAPRCPGLRKVGRHWELFSRDTTHRVYVAPYSAGPPLDHQAVRAAAEHVLPVASARYEPLPVPLAGGAWQLSVGEWVVLVRVVVPLDASEPAPPDDQLTTDCNRVTTGRPVGMAGRAPLPDATAKARAFLAHNRDARMAMAYYYQEFILGAAAPQEVPMPVVAAALNLTSQGAVSDYKRKLQDCIWNEQGHQRELGEFLLGNNLINRDHLEEARRAVQENEQNGQIDKARKRLQYRPKNTVLFPSPFEAGYLAVADPAKLTAQEQAECLLALERAGAMETAAGIPYPARPGDPAVTRTVLPRRPPRACSRTALHVHAWLCIYLHLCPRCSPHCLSANGSASPSPAVSTPR